MINGQEQVAGFVGVQRLYANLAQEITMGARDAIEQDTTREPNGAVDAVLNRAEDGDDNANEEDEHLQRVDAPETVDDVGRGDEVTDGMDDDGGQGGRGDVKEDGGEGVDGQQDDDGG